MIQANNPKVDVNELVKRVRAQAARLRTSGAVEARRGDPQDAYDRSISRAIELQRQVAHNLTEAERSNHVRTQPFNRLARISRLFPAIGRAALRLYNFLMRQPQETDKAQSLAMRYLLEMVVTAADYAQRTGERVRAMEQHRANTLADVRDSIAEVRETLEALSRSHDDASRLQERLREGHEALSRAQEQLSQAHDETEATAALAMRRIDDNEGTIVSIARRVEAIAMRHEDPSAIAAPLAERIDALGAAVRALKERSDLTPIGSEIRVQVQDELREVERRIARIQDQALMTNALIRSEIAALRPERGSTPPTQMQANGTALPTVPDGLYSAIESRFRGSGAQVAELEQSHVERVVSAQAIADGAPLLDLGCGHGEWLELLASHGVAAWGVDTSEIAVAQARERGVDARIGDAFETLSSLEDGSVGAVSAIHLVEHLPFPTLVRLLEQALRVLRPGGLVLLETPNPKNLVVSSYTFYFDPTHRNPIPSELLAFVVENVGFARVETIPLHDPDKPAFAADSVLSPLNEYFSGPQDYAVIACRP